MSETRKETPTGQNPDILRIIPDWEEYYAEHAHVLETRTVAAATGGTVDSFLNPQNKLEPYHHPVTIEATKNMSASQIAKLFITESTSVATLGELYPWNILAPHKNPWSKIRLKYAGRISSFDSGREEQQSHFVASALFDYRVIQEVDNILRSEGTDSLVKKAVLKSLLFSRFLFEKGKKIGIAGASKSGYEKGSDAVTNIQGATYAVLEHALPSGIYISSSFSDSSKNTITQILPALGAVKLHSDGLFHSPNTGPILTIEGNVVKIHPLFHDLKNRAQYFSYLPDLAEVYLKSEEGINRLEKALSPKTVTTQSVENDPDLLEVLYKRGTRAFVIEARGSGNASDPWKEALTKLMQYKDVTVIVITEAGSGNVDLKKYEAGLDIPGVLSGRTLREDAARVLAGIINDLTVNNQLPMSPQRFIEIFCYLSGMIELPQEEVAAFNQFFAK